MKRKVQKKLKKKLMNQKNQKKVKRNAEKYPVSKAYGTSSKYTELIEDGEA